MPEKEKRIVVIGGGMAGLSLSYFLLKKGYRVTTYEKANFWGGADAALEWRHVHIEKHYHHYFSHDKDILQLIEELGLQDRLMWRTSKTGVFYDGRPYNLDPLQFLIGFRPLSFPKRLDFMFKVWKIASNKNNGILQDLTACEWARGYFGKELTELMWEPLLKAKFGSSYNNIAASFLYQRIYSRAASRKKSKTKELLGYLKGSSNVLIARLLREIDCRGGQLLLGKGVERLIFNENSSVMGVQGEQGQEEKADAVVMAVQTPAAVRILKNSVHLPTPLIPELQQMESVHYQQVISLILFMKKRFSDYYWLNIADEEFPFPVIVEQTNFIGSENYQGTHMMYASTYREAEDTFYQKKDGEVFAEFAKFLRRVNPQFDESAVLGYVVNRERHATPVYTRGFKNLVTPLESRSGNLFYLNGTQVFPESRNVNKMVHLAKECAGKIEAL